MSAIPISRNLVYMAHKTWFVLENSRSLGPFSQTELENLINRHELKNSALVWREGQARWRPLEEAKLHRQRVLLPPVPKRVKPRYPRYPIKIIASFTGIIFLGLVFFLVFLSVENKSPLEELRPSVRKVLEDIRKAPYLRGEQRFGWAIDQSGMGLHMATNSFREAKISLRLTSISERILDQKNIVAKSQTEIKDGLAHFQDWKFQQGTSLPPGEYKIEAEAYAFGTEKKIFSHRGKILFYKGGRRDFERKLEKYQAVLARKKELRFSLQDRIQRYKSLVALIERLRILYRKGKSSPQKGHFESNYHKEIGPYLWGLISESDLLHLNWMNIDPVKGEDYEKLTDFGKEIGDLAVEMLDHLESKEQSRETYENFLAYANKLENHGQNFVERLKRQLKLDTGN